MTTVEDPQGAPLGADAVGASGCPVPHGMASMLPGCPVPHGTIAGPRRQVERSKADQFVWRLLRIQERPEGVSEAAANKAFQKSMMVSATRCTLTYVIFPFVIPLLGILRGVEAPLGVAIGSVAIVCDVFSIRRFFAADHKYRWWFSAIALGIIGLLFVLLVKDTAALVS